jgi:LCP family protein required for cell wall assembly
VAGISRPDLRAFLGRYVISLGVATALVAAGIVVVNRGIDSRVAKIHRVKLQLAAAPPQGANFLILGSDTRSFAGATGDVQGFGDPNNPAASGVNSDTMMVAHIEPDARRTVVVSFPRDLWVTIPGQSGMHKINAAYGIGGPQLVIDTLKYNFDLDIQHYFEVDFLSFQAIVNAIGSVRVSFPYPARDQNSGLNAIVAGCYPLDGAAALAYVRSRYLEYYIDGSWQYVGQDAPDLHRIARQQSFIRKLTGLAIQDSLSDPLLAVEISNSVLKYIKADTGLTRGDVNKLISAFRTVNVNDTQTLRFVTIPVLAAVSADGQDILTLGPDADQLITQLRTFGDNTPQPAIVPPSKVTVRVSDGTNTHIAGAVTDALAKQGFHGKTIAPHTPTVAVTEIHYAPDQSEEAKALLEYLNDARLVPDPTATGSLLLVLGTTFQQITIPSTTTTVAQTASPKSSASTTTTPTSTTVPANQDCS